LASTKQIFDATTTDQTTVITTATDQTTVITNTTIISATTCKFDTTNDLIFNCEFRLSFNIR